MYNEKDLRECGSGDWTCPYYDLDTNKCTMYAETGDEPKDECDESAE